MTHICMHASVCDRVATTVLTERKGNGSDNRRQGVSSSVWGWVRGFTLVADMLQIY